MLVVIRPLVQHVADEVPSVQLFVMDPAEALAKARFERIDGRTLVEWDVAPRQGAVDFRAIKSPTASVEVKRLTVQDFHAGLARVSSVPDFEPSDVLAHQWHLMVAVSTSGTAQPFVRMKGLREKLEPILVEFEARGVTSTRGASYDFDPATRTIGGPLAEYRRLIGDSLAIAHTATPHMPSGIRFASGWGNVCPDDPNALAEVVLAFVNDDAKSESVNLRSKLGTCGDDERHAFIVLTGAIEEAWLLDDWGVERLPTTGVRLPETIDVLWITRGGPTTWRADRTKGWQGFDQPAGPQ